MILPFAFTLLILQNQSLAAELVKRPNGYFVTGAGCGIDTPIKYMNYFPKDLEANQCTFINVETFAPINYFTITAKRSGRVIQAKSLSSIVIWDYTGEDSQLWYWDPSNGHFLRNKAFPNKVFVYQFYLFKFFSNLVVIFLRSCTITIQVVISY